MIKGETHFEKIHQRYNDYRVTCKILSNVLNRFGVVGYFDIQSDEGNCLCFHSEFEEDEGKSIIVSVFDTPESLSYLYQLKNYDDIKKYLLSKSI